MDLMWGGHTVCSLVATRLTSWWFWVKPSMSDIEIFSLSKPIRCKQNHLPNVKILNKHLKQTDQAIVIKRVILLIKYWL